MLLDFLLPEKHIWHSIHPLQPHPALLVKSKLSSKMTLCTQTFLTLLMLDYSCVLPLFCSPVPFKSIIYFCLGPCDLQWCTCGSILPLLIPLGLSYLLWPIGYEQTWCKPCFSRYLELLYGWLLLSFPLFSENHVLNRGCFLSWVLEWENSWSKSILADPQPLTYNVSRNKCVLL